MSEQKNLEVSVTVLNEEYERVLGNPDNVIVSDDLQELLDIPMRPEPAGDLDTMVISILGDDGLPISTRGEFSCLSKSGDNYSLILTAARVKGEFLRSLDSLQEAPGLLTVQGEYTLEIEDCSLIAWSVTQTAGADFSFSVQFRSENGIF
tara:strand:- start:5536 stop:5985 length:450 start_codon:yes stop_codon:yes gene_type:complete